MPSAIVPTALLLPDKHLCRLVVNISLLVNLRKVSWRASRTLRSDNLIRFAESAESTPISYFIIYVVVNFLFQVIFLFLLFLSMVIYANEVETKEKEKLPQIKN